MNTHPVLRIFRLRLVRGVILILLVMLGVGIIRSVYSLSQKKVLVTERKAVLVELEKQHAQLQQDLKEATSAAFIERSARDKLGLVKEGESIVIMNKAEGPELEDPEKQGDASNWSAWWGLFF